MSSRTWRDCRWPWVIQLCLFLVRKSMSFGSFRAAWWSSIGSLRLCRLKILMICMAWRDPPFGARIDRHCWLQPWYIAAASYDFCSKTKKCCVLSHLIDTISIASWLSSLAPESSQSHRTWDLSCWSGCIFWFWMTGSCRDTPGCLEFQLLSLGQLVKTVHRWHFGQHYLDSSQSMCPWTVFTTDSPWHSAYSSISPPTQ